MSAAVRLDLATAAARLNAVRGPRAQERRRFRRMPVIVGGRMLDGAGREQDCRTADLSPGDVRLAAPDLPKVDDRVVLYLDGYGRLTGRVARKCGENEVAIIFEMSTHKREKMAEALTWSMNKDQLRLDETPAPTVKSARVETEFGEIIDGEILDFSLAGMTIRTTKTPPPIGAWVRIGGVYGRVARRIEGGFAVDFESRGPKGF